MTAGVSFLPAALFCLTLALWRRLGWRDAFLRVTVLFGVLLVLITEALGALRLLRPLPILLCWALTALVAALRARPRLPNFRRTPSNGSPLPL